MASFSIPLTGLQAESTALNTIANNLADMNTTAFKSQSTQFSDLFYQQIGSSGAGRHQGCVQQHFLYARLHQFHWKGNGRCTQWKRVLCCRQRPGRIRADTHGQFFNRCKWKPGEHKWLERDGLCRRQRRSQHEWAADCDEYTGRSGAVSPSHDFHEHDDESQFVFSRRRAVSG